MAFKLFLNTFYAEKMNKNGEIPFYFLFLTVLVPILISFSLVKYEIFLSEKSISTLINVLAIFVGFLIASLVPYFEIAATTLESLKMETVAEKEKVSWEIISRRKLFKIIFPSIVQAIVYSLLALVILIFLSLLIDEKGKIVVSLFTQILNCLSYFLLSSSFFSIFNLIRRMSFLVIPVLEEQSKE